MKYRKFSQDLWNKIHSALDLAQEQSSKSSKTLYAAFDADGTLWDTDLGENFFQWQIRNKVLRNLPEDPWTHYRREKSKPDPRPAYIWLAAINKGYPITEVQAWAQKACDELSPPVFEDQVKLIEELKKRKIDVRIVTASIKWAVEPGAKLVGLTKDHVIGVTTAVENGIVTDKQDTPITYKQGKIEALRTMFGADPVLASGNSPGDSCMLAAATHMSLVVSATKEGHELYPSEESLCQEAQAKGWTVHRF
jgi:phosphoserine phosphatase